MAAIHLRRRLLDACSVLPGNGPGAHSSPIRTCSEWGLPSRPVTRRAGALLPHRFTLTDIGDGIRTPCPRPEVLRPTARRRSVSVALSVVSPRLGVTQHPCTGGARTFLPPTSREAAARPPGSYILPAMVGFTADAYPDIVAGRKTVTWRLWKYAHVKAGKQYNLGSWGDAPGSIVIDDVRTVRVADVTDADAREVGQPNAETLVAFCAGHTR